MVRGTVGGFGMLCGEWMLTLLKPVMEASEKLGRGGGCPYRYCHAGHIPRKCVERERRSVLTAGSEDQVSPVVCNTFLRP